MGFGCLISYLISELILKGAILTNPEIRGFDKGYPVMSSAIGDQDKSS